MFQEPMINSFFFLLLYELTFLQHFLKPCWWKQYLNLFIQAWIAQLVENWLGSAEVMGSNPGKGEDFSKKSGIYYKIVTTCFDCF